MGILVVEDDPNLDRQIKGALIEAGFVDEFHESFGGKLIRQPLHALATSQSHLGDLRHGQRAKQRETSYDTKCTAAPTGDESCRLAKSPYLEEVLGHFEHQPRLASTDPC